MLRFGAARVCRKAPHHCYLVVSALDRAVARQAATSKRELLDAMSGHLLIREQLVGVYER